MRSWLAAAVLICLFAPAAWAAEADDSWPATARAQADIGDHPLAEDRLVEVLPGARDEALGLLAKRAVVRLDAAAYARLSGRMDAWPPGLKPYLVRASERDDGIGSNHVYAASGHVLVQYNGPLVAANCRRAALILLLPFAPKLHISAVLYS